jgi:hypothetical protein
MKQFAVLVVLCTGLALVGCGSSNSTNVNGNWNATLLSNGNTTAFSFGTTLHVNSDGSLSVSNFQFTTTSACFATGTTESGGFTLSGNFNGQTSGAFTMTVQSENPSGNTLTLTGTDHGNTISGTWALTGTSGCSGSGSFTMTKV